MTKPNGALKLYSNEKALWHLRELTQLRAGVRPVPPHIQLIISDLCNHDCGFCAYRMSGYTSNQNFAENGDNNPNRMISLDKCVEILEDAAKLGVKAVEFTGGGEPTVHPQHLEVFHTALDLGFECGLVTNGGLLRQGWESTIGKFSWVRVSLDAGTPATYASIRKVKPSAFGRAVENIGKLVAAADGVVGVSFVVTRENYREIQQAAEVVAGTGASYIRYAAVFSPQDERYYDGLVEEIEHRISLARESDVSVLDMFTGRLGDLEQHSPDYETCGYQYFNVYIGGDLKVYRCCNTAYSDRGEVGSLKDRSFLSFMESDETDEQYKNFDPRGCERCAFNGKNRAINALIGEAPTHVNFV